LRPQFHHRIEPKHWLVAVVVLSTLLKLAFVFYGTAFQSYLGSDMGGYWTRALQRFNGDLFSINQWVIWPPLFHIILAYLFKLTYLVGLGPINLGIVLGLNVLFSSLSVFCLYRISERLTRSPRLALATATLYAFTYHCFYFNAFVLSENFAVPLSIAALYCLLQNRLGYFLLSGVLLAVATGIRPGYGLLALSFGLYALWPDSTHSRAGWLRSIGRNGVPKAALFSLGFLLVIGLVLAQNHYISNGRLKGLAASSGLNYFFSFTKTYEVRSWFDGYHYVIIPPGTVKHPENGKLLTVKPIYDSAFFEQLTNAHIRQHPEVLLFKLKDLWELYFGTLFPSYGSAFGFHPGIEIFKFVFFFLTLVIAFSFTTSLWRRDNAKQRWLILSIIALSLVTSYLFNSEHRYIYGFVFAIYLLSIEAIGVIAAEFKQHLKKMLLCVGATILILGADAGYSALRKQNMPAVIHMKLHDYNEPFDAQTLDVDTLNFPFEKTFTHQRFGELGIREDFDVEFNGRFEVHASMSVHFFVYCEEGFEFYVDQQPVLGRPIRDDEKELETILFLEQGSHDFRLRYFHRSEDAGIKAMYVPITDGRYGKYFLGQDTSLVTFHKPDRAQ